MGSAAHTHNFDLNDRPAPDKVLTDIADYVVNYKVTSAEAYNTARLCLMDTLACGIMVLKLPTCVKMLGSVVPELTMKNGVQIFFKDGSKTKRVEIEYPIGCRRRRAEGVPVLEAKVVAGLRAHYPSAQADKIVARCSDQKTLEDMKVTDFMAAWV